MASAVGGLTTLVEHGRSGYLVDGTSPERFAAAASRVIEDSLLAERLSTAAVTRAREYTWAKSAALLRETYEELAAERLVACR